MATFPSINPTYGMRKTSKPKVRVSSLGDGYEFRALYGLPLSQDPKVYDLTFNVSETDADVIEAFLRSRVNDQASFSFTPPAEGFTKTGTYSQTGTTVTISITSHGVAIGDILTIDYTTGSATDGTFVVASSADANTFTVTAAASLSTSGNVSITLSGAGQYVCDSWTKTIPYNERAIINTTFREVFEP
jgi:phage-related protein